MDEKRKDDIYYVCTMIEFVARVTNNRRKDVIKRLIDVFSSFISDEISNFNSNVYYSSPDYLRCSYEEGVLLA